MRPIALLVVAVLVTANAAAADEKTGRYMMSPIEGGVIRLDTETGAMALCKQAKGAWDCQAMADSSKPLQQENDRLSIENKELRDEVARLEELIGLGDRKKDGPQRRAERPGGEFRLPSEQDVDKAIEYVERMWKKLREKMKDFESGERRGPVL